MKIIKKNNYMMKRLLLTCMFGFVLTCAVHAAPVSLQRATEVANVFLTSTAQSGPQRVPARARLVSSSAAKTPYYIFENVAEYDTNGQPFFGRH